MKELNWSNEKEANEDIHYNHIILNTPIGVFTIEWKGWKEIDGKAVYLDGYYLADFYTVEEAKDFSKFKLLQTYNDIGAMLYE